MALFKLAETNTEIKIQQTTLGIDIIPRFICHTWEEATQDSQGIDVVVLGAGMYGGYCASKIYQLSKSRLGKPLRVLVLEAGPFILTQHGQNYPDLRLFNPASIPVGSGTDPGIREVVWGNGWRSNQDFVGQAYCVGGKSLYWGGWCPRLQPDDLSKWPLEIKEYLTKPDISANGSTRPITHKDVVTGALLTQGDKLSGYETVEYEIGVLPADDFVFDPTNSVESSKLKAANNALGTDKIQAGLNETLLFFLDKNAGTISPEITAVLPAPLAIQTQSYISGLFALDKYSSVPALISASRDDHSNGKTVDLRMAIVPNAHVVKLECSPSSESRIGTRIVHQIVVKVNGREETLKISPFCQVVMGMGCIESTRLALESFSLENSLLRAKGNEIMGRNFMVHLREDFYFKVNRAKFASFVDKTWPGKRLADILQLASLHIQCKGVHGSYQYQLYAASNGQEGDENLYRMIPDTDVQNQIAAGFNKDTISFILRSSGEVTGGKEAPIGSPDFDYIDLAGDADIDREFGHRRAWVQFKSSDPSHLRDPIWQDMVASAKAIATALDGGQLPLDFTDKLKQGVGTTYHDSGTLWIGDDPDKSVTDVNGHLHHVSNVYCCDQALFTTVGSANPVLTGVSLSRKVAQDIVSKHESSFIDNKEVIGFTAIPFDPSNGWKSLPYNGMQYLGNDIIETVPFPQNNPLKNIGFYYLPLLKTDFELYVEWKQFRGNDIPNAGILLRMPDPAAVDFGNETAFNNFYRRAIEIQIDESGKEFDPDRTVKAIFGHSKYKTGAVYGVQAASQWAAKVLAPEGGDNDHKYWNTYRIKAAGPIITVWLNGKKVCEAVTAGKSEKGFIGFQFHTGKVQFRKLFIK